MRGATRGSLTRHLVLVQTGVVALAFGATILVAALVAPAVFDSHMRQAGHAGQPGVLMHAQEAFRSAGLAAILAGAVIALVSAAVTSAWLMRRLGRDLDALAAGAGRIAAGRYDEPVQLIGSEPELISVATAFNDMSARIDHTEETRRRLLTDLAHELRTPLAVLDVTVEALEDGVVPLDATTVGTLRTQTGRLTRLAGNLTQLSAVDEARLDLHRRPTPVHDLLAAAAHAATASARRAGLTVAVPAGPVPGTVEVDPARLGQVLDNLVRNAIHHTPPGGRVELAARAEGRVVRIEVRDSGAGIDPVDLPHVFDRFYRGAPPRHRETSAGTGVGLAISRAIAVAHGGTLTAVSDGPGRGAAFILTLPLGGEHRQAGDVGPESTDTDGP